MTLVAITVRKNIHLNCDNYNAKKDFCLKFFINEISELKECQEKTVFNDTDLAVNGQINYTMKNCLILDKLDTAYLKKHLDEFFIRKLIKIYRKVATKS